MALKRLREDVFRQDSTPLRVDEQAGVIYGVRFLGWESANGYRYAREAVNKRLALYDGAFVNIDHLPSAPGQPAERSYLARFGRLRNPRTDDGGGRADLHYNPEHRHAKDFLWWAKNDPGAIGLSHDADVDMADGPDGRTVRDILKVHSVDVVADPATTRGLHESTNMAEVTATAPAPAPAPDSNSATHLGNAILAVVNDTSLDPAEKRKKVLAILKLLDDAPAPEGDAGDAMAMESVRRMGTGHGIRLVEAYSRLRESQRLESRRKTCRQLCRESGLPDQAVTDVFVEQLAQARDDAGVRALIEDRRAVSGLRTQESVAPAYPPLPAPTSAGPAAPQLTYDAFLAGIHGNRGA